ncbi:cytochrome P450 monooxygenase [Xylariaceae sp. FL0804]|nr:cytochrome P450 monooxygenase [Xylariaceae sp. FL0804]
MNASLPSPSATPLVEHAWSSLLLLSSQPLHYFLATIIVMAAAIYAWTSSTQSLKSLPYVNPPKLFSNAEARRKFLCSGKDMLKSARKQLPNQPFRLTSDFGEVIMLPSEFVDEVRNHPNLSFSAEFEQGGIGDIPGFEPFATVGDANQLLQIVAKKQLTKMLARVTQPLSEEAALALSLNMGDSSDWSEIAPATAVLDIVARMSSRVFLGEELCRQEDWLRLMKNYTVCMMQGINALQRYPGNFRKYVHWFLPECKVARAAKQEADDLVSVVIDKRRAIRQEAMQKGQPIPRFDDALDWMHEEAESRGCAYDATNIQLMLSVAAIHTTTDLLSQVILDLAQHPEAVQSARDEIAQVLRAEGWKKTSLHEMKLLDSLIKESQRIKPLGSALIRRTATADVELSTGLVLKKGSRMHVDTHRMQDPAVYENPEQWDAGRYLRLRSQPGGKGHAAQLVSTSVDHFGFGHGAHACPGRFFAANEVKVALCHLLMKYDFKLAPGTETAPVFHGMRSRVNPSARILVRRRGTVELDIDSI